MNASLPKAITRIASSISGQAPADLLKLIEKNEGIRLTAEMFNLDPRIVAAKVYLTWLQNSLNEDLTGKDEAA